MIYGAMLSPRVGLFVGLLMLVVLPSTVSAFGAGNIASISKIEGHNFRHGDIEDMLKNIAFLRGHKWTSLMIKRVYFGNWLRDYSQALDVGTLKGLQSGTIRLLIWILSFMSFGYATGEFEVTDDRLGVYRPEEHIDNPRDYADNKDARTFDERLRGPVLPEELAVDPKTAMKNYIANEEGDWATSLGYVKFSFTRSIHFGRVYTSGANSRGREEDLCEALRCLGQGLHCLEDFGAHTNYTELALRELGYHNVFSHTGSATEINFRGKRVFPLVTGTFGGVDFLHSVLGEATDHVTQSEVDEVNKALGEASMRMRGYGSDSTGGTRGLTDLLSKVPGTGSLCREAFDLQAASDAQAAQNNRAAGQFQQQAAELPGSNVPSTNLYPGVYPGPQASVKPPAYGGPDNSSSSFGQGVYPGPQGNSQPEVSQSSSFTPEASTSNFGSGVYPGPPTSSHATGPESSPLPNPNAYPGPPPLPQQSGSGQSTTFSPPVFPGPPGSTAAVPSGSSSQPAAPAGMTIDTEATIRKIYPILQFRDRVVRSLNAIVEKIPGLETLIETIQERITLFIMSLLAPYIQPVITIASAQLKTGSSTVIAASARSQFEPWTDPTCTDPTHSLLSKDHFSNILNCPAGLVASQILTYVAPRIIYAWDNPGVPVDEVLADISRVFHHPAARDPKCELHRNMFDTVQRWARGWTGGDLNTLLSSESVKAGRNHIALDERDAMSAGGAIFGLGSHSAVSGGPMHMLGLQRGVGDREGGAYGTSYASGGEGSIAQGIYGQQQQQEYGATQSAGAHYPTYEETLYASQQQP